MSRECFISDETGEVNEDNQVHTNFKKLKQKISDQKIRDFLI
jgi:hypothetical protein